MDIKKKNKKKLNPAGSQKYRRQILTQFGDDFLYADLAPAHQVSDSVKALTERLLCFLQAEKTHIMLKDDWR